MGEKFDFNKLIPYPIEYRIRDDDHKKVCNETNFPIIRVPGQHKAEIEFIKKYGDGKDGFNNGGYEWCCKNWGTKWGAIDVKVYDSHIVFYTAWSYPLPIFIELAKTFQDMTMHFEWFERGMSFCGGFTCNCLEDHYDDEVEWFPGVVSSKWEGEYHGHKGG